MTTIHPKKKPRWIDLLLIGIILTLTVLTIFLVSTRDEIIYSHDDIALAAPSEVLKEKSKYDGIYIVTEKSSDKNAPFTIQYPKTSSKVFNQSVKDTIHKTRDQYLKDMEKLLHNEDHIVGNLTISNKTIVHKKNYYSFVLTQTITNGTGSKQKSVKTFLYDQKNNKQILLQDIVPSQKSLPTLANSVKKEMSKDKELENLMHTTLIKNATKPIWINFTNYSLTDHTLTIYYDSGTLSKNIKTIKTVHIPLSSINNILAQPYKVKVKKTVKQPTKVVALTFDDGPSNTVTPKILKILKKHNAKATFFMVGNQVHAHPKMAKQVFDEGHEVGNHSYSHANLKQLSNAQIKSQLSKTNKAIKKATGHYPTLVRPPYGSVDKRVRAQTKLPIILWSVDTRDWEHRNSKKLLSYVKKYTYPGAIILMHDIHMPTANGLDNVLTYLEKQGYTFVTVSELNKMKKKK